MNCQNCGNPNNPGDQFCGHCGAPLAQPAVPVQVAPEHVAAPAGQPVAAPPPPAGVPVGLIIALSVAGVLLVAGMGVGGYFALRALSKTDTPPPETATPAATTPPPTTTPDIADTADAAPLGFATVEEAIKDQLPDGWVYDMLSDDGDSVEYVTGPPNSEYTDVLVLAKQSDGSWSVTDSYAFDMGDMDGTGGASTTLSPEDDARQVVGEFLYAVKEDRANDAHAFTVPPFSEDPASAQFSNGDLKSVEVLSATLQSDNTTVKVRSRETWTWGTEEWVYVCIPTQAGCRITELLAP